MNLHLRFWREEEPLRLRSWWRRHWWPARIRQIDRERADWKRWCETAEHNDLLEMAWVVIANASDWNTEDKDESEWLVAARRWRDDYHGTLAKTG